MPIQVILHLQNTEPVLGEVDELPTPQDHLIKVRNPRKRDGKDLSNLEPEVEVVYWPVERLNFIEVLPTDSDEPIIGFVRE